MFSLSSFKLLSSFLLTYLSLISSSFLWPLPFELPHQPFPVFQFLLTSDFSFNQPFPLEHLYFNGLSSSSSPPASSSSSTPGPFFCQTSLLIGEPTLSFLLKHLYFNYLSSSSSPPSPSRSSSSSSPPFFCQTSLLIGEPTLSLRRLRRWINCTAGALDTGQTSMGSLCMLDILNIY